jgi:hypothetical protein
MFSRTPSKQIFAPSGLEALRAGRPKLRQSTDQSWAEPRPQINTDESLPNNLTADFRRFSHIRIRTFHRRDAERQTHSARRKALTDNRSTDDRNTEGSEQKDAMRRSLILTQYSVLSTRNSVLSALCALRHALSDLASAVIHSLSAIICVNQRLIVPNPLRLAHFPWRAHIFAPLRISDAQFHISYLRFTICNALCWSLRESSFS